MSTPVEKIEPFNPLPDRLSIAEFDPDVIDRLLGSTLDSQTLAKENFNWVAAYLVEEIGLFENEVAEWFLSGAEGLHGKTPLDVWEEPEGFVDVFEYAKTYKQKVDEALDEEGISREYSLERSHETARNALNIILPGLVQIVGVDLMAGKVRNNMTSRSIWNPNRPNSPIVRWKSNGELEDYRVTIKDGEEQATYYIARALIPDERPLLLQSGIVRTFRGETDMYGPSTSDLDGRPPSPGEVAAFVIPVANEMRNGRLALMVA